MTTTITDGITSVIPDLYLGYSHRRRSGNILHGVIGAPEGSPSLEPAGLRSGSVTFLFSSQADAFDADELHTAGVILTLTDTDVPAVNMTYMLAEGGACDLEQDPERVVWLLTIEYQEVDA